jgi:hypothetical protein
MPFRLLMSVVFCLCVWWAHHVRAPGQTDFPVYFYLVLLFFYALHQVKCKEIKVFGSMPANLGKYLKFE